MSGQANIISDNADNKDTVARLLKDDINHVKFK